MSQNSLVLFNSHGANAFNVDFVSNDPYQGKKVISSIEDSLAHCTSFSISVAFITKGGIAPLLQTLKNLENANIPGKILTTDYLTFSDPSALETLSKLKNIELKMFITDREVSSDKAGFHTKGYIFKNVDNYRILIGSSNLTLSALTLNKEWNSIVEASENEKYVCDVLSEFNDLWNSNNSLHYSQYASIYKEKYNQVAAQKKVALLTEPLSFTSYNLVPNRMQEEFIDNLKELIENGEHRALLISATGTGKTYAAAFAMRAIKAEKILFIVHREQIAKQALESFNIVFNNQKKLKLLSGNSKDIKDADIVFATLQTVSKDDSLNTFEKYDFDAIIIDEAHRAGASSYQKIFNYFKPNLFLGMTASPERTDDFDIFKLFDHNIAYEIRLQQALDNNFLCPFHYFGITDFVCLNDEPVDLSDFKYLVNGERFKYVLDQVKYYSSSGDKVKGLVFCSRNEEAKEISLYFNKYSNFKTAVLSGSDSQEKRAEYVNSLESDDENGLDYIFTVDIFNEGIDIPSVNQIVMLRPTQSPIVFLQQLGRGLRKYQGKEYVVVLDFIGNYQNNFMIPIALSGDKSYKKDSYREFITESSKFIPGASTIHFDEISKRRIFESIDTTNFTASKLLRDNYISLKNKLGKVPSLMDFEKFGYMDVQCIFSNKNYGSYHNFLVKLKEKDYSRKLSESESNILKFVCQKIANGKRKIELELLSLIVGGSTDNLFKELHDSFKYDLTDSMKTNLKNILSNNFITGSEKDTFVDAVFVEDNPQNDDIKASYDFTKSINTNEDFKYLMSEVIEYGIDKYTREYSNTINSEFSLYKKYSYFDVCRLLNWSESIVPLNIGGYKYDKTTNTFPIFVNYIKSDSINSSIKYEDTFIDKTSMKWISKSKRTLSSPEIQLLKDFASNGVDIELFIRKNNTSIKLSEGSGKNKESFKEFFYLGKVIPDVDSFKEIQMNVDDANTVSAVEIKLNLVNRVRDDIFDYIVNK